MNSEELKRAQDTVLLWERKKAFAAESGKIWGKMSAFRYGNIDTNDFLSNFLNEFIDDDVAWNLRKITSALNTLIYKNAVKLINPYLEIYDVLVEDENTHDNYLEFNDYDSLLWYVEVDDDWYKDDDSVDDRKVLVYEDQNYKWLIVIDISEYLGTTMYIRDIMHDGFELYKSVGFTLHDDYDEMDNRNILTVCTNRTINGLSSDSIEYISVLRAAISEVL